MSFLTYLYNSLIRPVDIIGKNRSIKFAIYIYIISILATTLSLTLISNTRTSIVLLIFLAISIALYYAITNIIYISIIHLFVSLLYSYKPRQSVKTLLLDLFVIHRVFILLLPLSLFLSIFPSVIYKVLFVLSFVAICIYYIYNFCQIININIKLENSSHAIFMLAVIYILPNIINVIFTISYIIILLKVITSFLL